MNLENLDAYQFVDFTKIDNFTPDDTYFDKHTETDSIKGMTFEGAVSSSNSRSNVAADVAMEEITSDSTKSKVAAENKSQKKSSRVFHFTAAPATRACAVAKGTKTQVACTKSNRKEGQSKVISTTAVVKLPRGKEAAGKVKPKPAVKKAVEKSGALKKPPAKRPLEFANPRPVKRMKTTQPTTPECLKRSLNKVTTKVIKSSEEIELEHIAELQQETVRHLKTNKVSMKKIFPGSALKPIVPVQEHIEAKNKNVKSLIKGPVPKNKPMEKENIRNMKPRSHKLDFHSSLKFATPLRTSTPYGSGKNAISSFSKEVPKHPAVTLKGIKDPKIPSHSAGVFFIQKQEYKKSEPLLLSSSKTSTCDQLSVTLEKLSFQDLGDHRVSAKSYATNVEKKSGKNVKPLHKQVEDLESKRVGKNKQDAVHTGIKTRSSKKPLNDITSSCQQQFGKKSDMKRFNSEADMKCKSVKSKANNENSVKTACPVQRITRSKSSSASEIIYKTNNKIIPVNKSVMAKKKR